MHPVAVVRAVEQILDQAKLPALVLSDTPLDLSRPDVTVCPVADAGDAAPARTVVLVAGSVVELRLAVSRLAGLGKARVVGCVVAGTEQAVLVRTHPAWPALSDLEAGLTDGVAHTRVELSTRHDAAAVLLGIARAAALPVAPGPDGVWMAGAVAPPVDPTFATAYDPGVDCPPDVVVGATEPLAESPVLGRPPLVVVQPDDVLLDEAVFNPCGFRRTWERGVVDLPAGTALTPALVISLRDAQAVRPSADASPELRAGLAMCGVPTEAHDDPAERERHSVRTRRAALLRHASFAWRDRVAAGSPARPDEEQRLRRGWTTTAEGDDATDLLLAARYSGADLVVLPDDVDGPTECFVATPPPGAVAHRADRSPAAIVAAGGLVYLTRPRGRG